MTNFALDSAVSALDAAAAVAQKQVDAGGTLIQIGNPVFEAVAKFMRASGQFVADAPSSPSDQSDLYKRLVDEEYREFVDAINANDDTEQADAVADLIWVLVGYAHSRGWNLYGMWEEVSRTNLSKIDAITGKVIRREDGKILKPAGWQEPNFEQFVK